MKIEGLAVDPSDKYLFVGLREPVDRARVYAFPLEALRRGDPSLRPDVWVEFDAGFVENTPYCISALLWEPTLQGLLVLLHITAHPDDEHGGMLTLSSRGQGVRVSLLSLTPGEAGANAIGPELFDDLGSIRAEELTLAGRYYGLDALYFTRLADYGYSTIALWGPRCLSDLGEPTVARATAYWPVARIWRARDTRSSPPPGAPSGPLEVMTSVPLSMLSK